MSDGANPWLLVGPGSAEASPGAPGLICLPHLGGNAAMYGWWAARLAPDVRVLPVQLPGHGTRGREAPLRSIPEIAEAMALAFSTETERPYVLYGHSFGALVAFEFARLMSALGQPPRHLVVGASAPPSAPLDRPFLHASADADIVAYLAGLGGMPDELLRDAAVLQTALPAVRADLEALETYRYVEGDPLPAPITAVAGTADPTVDPDAMAAWGRHTRSGFRLARVAGGHFFLRDAREEVLALLRDAAGLRAAA